MWKIKAFPGGREFLLRAKFSLPSVAAEEEQRGRMPPIRVAFEIPYFTVSGIQAGPSRVLRVLGLGFWRPWLGSAGACPPSGSPLRSPTSPCPASRRASLGLEGVWVFAAEEEPRGLPFPDPDCH